MHSDQIAIDDGLVTALLAAERPAFAALPRRVLPARGTQNHMIRLGDDLVLRLPLIPAAVPGIETEARFLPALPPLGLDIPRIRHHGQPGPVFPYPWLVQDWLPGDDTELTPPSDLEATARQLADFLTRLHTHDVTGAPKGNRGGPPQDRAASFDAALARCEGLFDTARAAAHFRAALDAPGWDRAPVWLHADLIPANLIARDGRLSAVIDWGSLSSGDPAWDLIPAWFLLDAAARPLFRELTGADAATWTRARGHVIAQSVIALPYYLHTNPAMIALARRGLAEALPEEP